MLSIPALLLALSHRSFASLHTHVELAYLFAIQKQSQSAYIEK